jgi:hypothetical protein
MIAQPTIDALAWTLIHFLWQGALLGVLAFFLLRLARPERSSTRYAIGVTTLALMLITCVSTFVVLTRSAPANTASHLIVFPITASGSQQLASIDETVHDVTRDGGAQSIVRTTP